MIKEHSFAYSFNADSIIKCATKTAFSKAKDVVTKGGDISRKKPVTAWKEALNAGIGEAVDFLSTKDGYFKSPYKFLFLTKPKKKFPNSKCTWIRQHWGWQPERMNRAAEDAATKASQFCSRHQRHDFPGCHEYPDGQPGRCYPLPAEIYFW